tara:strand:- start:1514 stop:2443 length:930 start_codon:yes stop_codon:yes gene_type:complete
MSTLDPEITSIREIDLDIDDRLIGEMSYSKKMQKILRILKMRADGEVPAEVTHRRVTLIEFLKGIQELIKSDGDVPLRETFTVIDYNYRINSLMDTILNLLDHERLNRLKNAEIMLHQDTDIQGAYFITLNVTPREVFDAYNPHVFLRQLSGYLEDVLEGEVGGKRKVVKRKRKVLKKKRKTKRKGGSRNRKTRKMNSESKTFSILELNKLSKDFAKTKIAPLNRDIKNMKTNIRDSEQALFSIKREYMTLLNEPNSMFDDIEKKAMLQQIVGYANLVKQGKEILEGLEFEKIMREEKFRKRLESLNLK